MRRMKVHLSEVHNNKCHWFANKEKVTHFGFEPTCLFRILTYHLLTFQISLTNQLLKVREYFIFFHQFYLSKDCILKALKNVSEENDSFFNNMSTKLAI